MANLNNPFGLLPLYVLSGGPTQTEEYSKVVGYGTAVFAHDVVARVSGGAIQIPATPGTTLISGVSINYSPASTAAIHTVIVGTDQVYIAQGDGSGSLNAADEGLNANLVFTAGNAATKQSKHQVAESTKATTATLDVHLLRIAQKPDNADGANARFEILISKYRLAPGGAGV